MSKNNDPIGTPADEKNNGALSLEKEPEEITGSAVSADEENTSAAEADTDAEETEAASDSEETEENKDSETDEKDETDETDETDEKAKKKDKEISPQKLQKKQESAARRSLKARAFKKGWFSIALVAVFIAGVIVINMIASALVDKVPALVADTTGSDSFDLTDETLDYINKLNEDIKLIVLCDEKTYREGGEYYIQADALLHKYEDNSSRITLEFIDLASNPTFVSQYPDESLTQYSIIVQGEKEYKYLKTTDYFDVQLDYSSYQYYIAGSKVEEAVTSAILNVTLDDKPKVAFISDISDLSMNSSGYTPFMSYLANNGFETSEISPAIGEIGSDIDILVLYDPNIDLDAAFVDKISAFLNNGGSYGKQLLYLPGSSLVKRPNLDSLLEEWGVALDNGYAVENDMSKIQQISYGVYLFATDYSDTTYSEKMKNPNLPVCTFYGNGIYTHPVTILDENKAKSLLTLSEQSTIIYPPETGDNAESAEPTEESSPSLAVGVLATKGASRTSDDTDTDGADTAASSSNIIVLGSNFMVTESFLSSNMYGNAPYMLSLLNTLVGRDNVGLTIETQSLKGETLNISTVQLRVLTVLYAVFIPLCILIAGIVVYIKRRNK